MNTKRLYRSCTDRLLGGVAGGIAEYLDIDSILVRLILLILLFSGVGIVVYIIAWVIIPADPNCKNAKDGAEEIKEKAEAIADSFKKNSKTESKSADKKDITNIFGILLLVFGLILLTQNIIGPFVWQIFWPGVLVVVGLLLIFKHNEER